jgi:uncharacterized membrane protein YjjP (DUF1212 family)
VLETTSLAGHILLENGAEIARVEETMDRISSHYDIGPRNFFVLSNGIFTTGHDNFAKVEFIPFKGAQLERVVAVNQVSRDICEGKYKSLDEANERLGVLTALDFKDLPDSLRIRGIAADAPNGVGGIKDGATLAEHLHRLSYIFVSFSTH